MALVAIKADGRGALYAMSQIGETDNKAATIKSRLGCGQFKEQRLFWRPVFISDHSANGLCVIGWKQLSRKSCDS
jgi:hypothetical protein